MNDFFKSLADQFKASSGASKAIFGMVAVAMVAVLATFGIVAKRPHYQMLFSGMSAAESAKVARALADAGIPFELSQPPGPFVVYADESDRMMAMRVVASSGAMEHAPNGILSGDSGMSTVFMSANERAQVVLKREWQEVERLLEDGLDFVVKAKVQTSNPVQSPYGETAKRTGSVTLQLRGGSNMSREQGQTVADLVRFALHVDPDNLIISDQSGKTLYSGSGQGLGNSENWLEQKLRYDSHMADKASQLLSDILGPDKARVTVDSTWNYDLSTKIIESTDPKQRVAISETTSSTKTPQYPPGGAGAGTVTGMSAAGETGSGQSSAPVAAADPPTSQTKQDSKDYVAPMQTTQTVRTTPTLERLSISLFLDSALAANATDLTASVKAAVGFDQQRGDDFSLTSITFVTPEVAEVPAVEPSPLLSPMLENLLRRGVEIISAIVFLFVLFKGIKGAKEIAARKVEVGSNEPTDAMLETLAKARIEELIGEDPEKISQVLSAWARDGELATSHK